MAAGYVVVEMKISDPDRFGEYAAVSPATVRAAGGEYLVRGGRSEAIEGDWNPPRVAVLRFPTYDQAKAWYEGEAYRQARAKRAGATAFLNMLLVEGVPAP